MTLDAAYLNAKAGECRARAEAIADPTLRRELLSLADYYDLMASELGAQQPSLVPIPTSSVETP